MQDIYELRLEAQAGEVMVTVLQDGEFADGLAAERLLKVIKEYST